MLNRLFPQCLRQSGREPELNRVVVLRGLLAFIFLGAGIMKLVGAAESMAHFDDLGLPGWMALVIGVAEVACAVLLFIPTGFVAAILGMLAIMAGAAVTMALHGELPTPPVITAALVILLWRWQNHEAITG